ncbi:MAG TPA: hypothetical protein VNT81_09470, partial [Vicinamibacterales bacterium]|nr:hypothetical protein [Vicinamibacterales bacterium]
AAHGSEGGAQDRVAGIIAATRKAMGGEDKITGLKTLTAEGPFRRMMGGRDMEGIVTVSIARPDKMHRVEDMAMGGMVGGPTIERTMVLNGTTSWEDSQNRGGMGGGMRIMINSGPGPGGPGGAALTQEQIDEARTRRMRVQMQRLSAALFADAGLPWVDAGVAESPDGKADILEAKEETGRTLRLFIDQGTKLPLMVQYQDPKPRIMINNGGPGGPGRGPGGPGRGPGGPGAQMTPEQMKERLAEMQRTPPEMGTYAYHLSDFKKVDGVMLPHKIETSLDGEPNEEWTIEKYKVNAQLKADLWQKK